MQKRADGEIGSEPGGLAPTEGTGGGGAEAAGAAGPSHWCLSPPLGGWL